MEGQYMQQLSASQMKGQVYWHIHNSFNQTLSPPEGTQFCSYAWRDLLNVKKSLLYFLQKETEVHLCLYLKL
jgi:hypothetical protein